MKQVLFITILFISNADSYAQLNNVKIKGRIYYPTNSITKGGQSSVRNSYLTDFKVILVKISSAGTDTKFVETYKQRFCSGHDQVLRRYPARVAYTNTEGSYEFANLQPNAYYMLIFCDSKIQVSLISTGASRITTYKVKDKKVSL